MPPTRALGPGLALALLLPALAVPALPSGIAAWQPGRNDFLIPMSDGAVIDATMVVPAGTPPDARLPALVAIHGYGGSKAVGDAALAASRGYVGFAYSTRGFGKSTGQMDVVGPRSIQDLKELVAWLKANGPVDAARVGVFGCSYGGGHSVLVATHPDAGVAAVAPCVPWTDLGRALRPNGAFKLSYAAGFYATGNGLVQSGDQPVPLQAGPLTLSRRQLYDTYEPEVHVGFAALVADVGQGSVDQFFRERSAALRVANIRIPIFVILGLNDDLFPGDQGLPFFSLIPTAEKKLYLGFVGHPRANPDRDSPEAKYVEGLVFQFFDHYLKGSALKPFDPARPIEVARTPWDGSTIQIAEWPAGETGQAYALNADGSLGSVAGAAGLAAVSNTLVAGMPDDPVLPLVSPSFQQAPPGTPADTLAFRSAVLSLPVELLGTPRAELQVRSAGASFQVAVKVFDVAPDGKATLVTRGIYRVKDNIPGVEQRLIFDLQPYRYTFEAGHRVEVRVAASDFPAYMPERGPFTVLLSLGQGGSLIRLPLGAPLP